MKPNYFYKAQFLNTDLPLYQRKISKLNFQIHSIQEQYLKEDRAPNNNELRLLTHYDDEIKSINDLMRSIYGFDFYDSPQAYDECNKINHAYYNRVNRLLERVEIILQKPCLLLTFTWDNEHINESSIETKRKYVQRVLNKLGCHYVANIDYGSKNDRVHFHALAQIDKIDNTNKQLWCYGALNFKQVRVKNSKALSKYLHKLTNHAIKETTKGCRIMYDRLSD